MKKAILLGSLAIALTACSNNDESTTIDTDNNGQAMFSASIEGQNKTRAYDRTWEEDDQIGITGTSGDKTYTNVAYGTDGNAVGNFRPVDTPIYYQDDYTVNFTAYYPWKNLAAGTTAITADTWVQSGAFGQKSFDFLYATGQGSKQSFNVAFTFSHKMAKLALTIKKGTDVTFDEVKAVKLLLTGFNHKGTFNVADGRTATEEDTEPEMWQFANNTENVTYNAPVVVNEADEILTYTLIMFPQEFTRLLPFSAELTDKQTFSATLDFTAANENAGDTALKNEWVAGRQYNMSVTLNKTSITVDGCTITKWQEANGGNVDAN